MTYFDLKVASFVVFFTHAEELPHRRHVLCVCLYFLCCCVRDMNHRVAHVCKFDIKTNRIYETDHGRSAENRPVSNGGRSIGASLIDSHEDMP